MPIFKTTQNIFKTPWEDELFNPNWMDSNTLILPPKKDWDYKRELTIEDVQVWEQIFFQGGGTGLFAAWDPHAEFYLVTKNLYSTNENEKFIETYYGKHAGAKAYKKARDLGMPIQINTIWVEDEEMWLYN
jgi:inosine-uridine nucleoside N-ribohydrolase